jgi:hypothetical protein
MISGRCVNGHDNPQGMRFCGQCGETLCGRPVRESNADSHGPPEQRSGNDAENSPLRASQSESEIVELAAGGDAKDGSKGRWVIVAAASVVLLAAGVLVTTAAGSEEAHAPTAAATVVSPETTAAVTPETTTPQGTECKAGQRQYRGEARNEYQCENGNWVGEIDWESECPGTKRQVIYNGESTAGYGKMSAAFPTGTRQSSPDLPIHLEGDSSAQGMHFCVSPGEFLYISLQNPMDTGSIECSIKVDGRIISRNSSSGGYVIASCDGTA